MPPRKRAQSTPTEPSVEAPQGGEAPELSSADQAPEEVTPSAPGAEDSGGNEPSGAADAAAPPERSDLQDVDEPCTQCFPGGWPDVAHALGCEHGTWMRT